MPLVPKSDPGKNAFSWEGQMLVKNYLTNNVKTFLQVCNREFEILPKDYTGSSIDQIYFKPHAKI